jgi:hypothetical protein
MKCRAARDAIASRSRVAHRGQLGARLGLLQQVAPDETRVGLAEERNRLARPVMRHARRLDAPVRHASTYQGQVNHRASRVYSDGYAGYPGMKVWGMRV